MISIAHHAAPSAGPLLVDWDDRLQFWPFRVTGAVRVGGATVERSWRGPTLREALVKAARAGCLSLAGTSLDAVCAAVDEQLETAR